ncbi:MAG: hypothetical protein OEY52_02580 [Gammaproteobacteria bacterium]|nr:hypothetical protein [Gammaproteobacteria bacterium]
MSQDKDHHINISPVSLVIGFLFAAAIGGLITKLILSDKTVQQDIAKPTVPDLPIAVKKLAKPSSTTPDKKTQASQEAANKTDSPSSNFIIKGLISTAGEPWSPNMIRVKLLWLKNRNKQDFLIGHEQAQIQMTEKGMAYRFRLRPQPNKYVSFNGGVEGNIARVIAFVDWQQDGTLSRGKDRIFAVSKEILRYRTGRYDKSKLNEIQIANIRQAGKGYVFIRNEPDANGKLDWRVVADQSPIRLDLDASETSLPGMYNTFLKLR